MPTPKVLEIVGKDLANPASGSTVRLAEQVAFNPAKFASKTLLKEDGFRLLLLALLAGQAVPTHQTAHCACLQCLSGEVQVTIGDTPYTVATGEMLRLPQAIDHSVVAVQDSKLLLTIGA